MRHELTELGKRVRVWQVLNGVSTNALCQMVRERTQAASPRSYIWSVLCGKRKSEKVTAALEAIITEIEKEAEYNAKNQTKG